MSKKTDAMKEVFVAFGYGSDVTDYTGHTVVEVLKEFAVEAEIATSVDDISAKGIAGVLNYIAENSDTGSTEPK